MTLAGALAPQQHAACGGGGGGGGAGAAVFTAAGPAIPISYRCPFKLTFKLTYDLHVLSQQSAAVVKPCKLSLVFSTPRIRRTSPAAAAEGSCFRADPPPCIPKDVETTAGAASLAAVVVAAAGWAWDIR